MRKFFVTGFILIFTSLIVAQTLPSPSISTATLESSHTQLSEKSAPIRLAIKVKLPEGWHTYGDPPGESGLPPQFTWKSNLPINISPPQYQPAKKFVFGGVTSYGYDTKTQFEFELSPQKKLKSGQILNLEVQVKWLVCKEICKPEKHHLTLRIPIQETEKKNPSFRSNSIPNSFQSLPKNWLFLLILAALGGLILNAMPCVLPVLSLKLIAITQLQTKHEKRLHSLSYTAGVIITFWVISLIILILKTKGQELGWGFQLQSPGFIAFLFGLFILIALNLLGIFEVGVSLTRLQTSSSKQSILSSFLTGILSTLVATPCSAPFIGTTVGLALSTPSLLLSFGLFTSMAIGLCLPFLALGLFPSLPLPKPKAGAWMLTLKQGLAFPILLTSAWLLGVFAKQTNSQTATTLLLVSIVIAALAWIYGKLQIRQPKWAIFVLIFTAITTILAARIIITPPSSTPWEPYSKALLETYQNQNQTIFVDFTADWCLTCKTNEKLVLNTTEIQALFKEKNVKLLKGDWTQQNTEISQALGEFNRSSVPLYILYTPQNPPQILPEVLSIPLLKKILSNLSN